MKKATGIAFIFIFLLYIFGIQLLYSIRINAAKNQSQALINSHKVNLVNTTEFSFSPDQYKSIEWFERNKEFVYKGQHYDIISLQFYTDEINITCYNDNNETNLVTEFTGYIIKMFSQNQKTDDNDIASKICKEYLPKDNLDPEFFFHVITTINAHCVLVNQHALIADVWRPPSLA